MRATKLRRTGRAYYSKAHRFIGYSHRAGINYVGLVIGEFGISLRRDRGA